MQTTQSPKTMKPNIKWTHQPQKQISQGSYMVKQHNTQGLNSDKLNRQIQPFRSKTEHVDEQQKKISKKIIKTEKQFSEQYLSLVNKLRVNLSKQHFQRKRSKVIVFKERKSQRSNFSHQLKSYISESSFSKENLPIREKKVLISYQFGNRNFNESKQVVQKLDLSNLRLSLQKKKSSNTLQKRVNQNQEIRYLHLQSNRMAQNKFNGEKTSNKNNLSKKLSIIKQERKKIKLKPIQHQHSVKNFFQLKEINLEYTKVEQLCFHTEILFNMYQLLSSRQISQVISMNLSYSLKRYILGYKKFADENQRQIYDDISNIQCIFMKKEGQERMRSLVLLERILIVYSIDLIANSNLKNYRNQLKQILQYFLGLYIYLLYVIKEYKQELSLHFQTSFDAIVQKVTKNSIHLKKQTQTLYHFIYKKLLAIMKTNSTLLQQFKILVGQFQKRNVGINRSFYQILKVYAIYLNNNQILIQKNYNLLKTFSTCPSPYLTKPNSKIYTLVLDLDQTLIYSQNYNNKLQIFMRPFVKQFLTLMGQTFQIVIFTSSLPEYSEDIINQLPCIQHRLYRYHTTRLRNKFMKDLSRLGRTLDKVIIIDNNQQSFALQNENGIKIAQWRGTDSTDQQLNILALFLSNLCEQKVQDVRIYVSTYKQFRQKYH